MMKKDVIAGLDLGSGRISCLIGSLDQPSGKMKVLGGSAAACHGIKGGVVVNIQEAHRGILKAVEDAEASAAAAGGGRPMVTGLYLGVRGSHLTSFNSRGALNIARTDKEITHDDVFGVLGNAKAVHLSSDRQILHTVPQGYALDRQPGVENPEGMEASLLEVEVHIVTGATTALNNTLKAVAAAGFEVIEPVYGLLATGELLVTREERELGCVLIDLGGQSTSVGVYCDKSLRYSKELPFGTDIITRDLAQGLRTSHATAERIKTTYGVAYPALLNGDEDISYHRIDGRTPDSVKTKTMVGYILPRVEELFGLIAEDLKKSSYADMIGSGGAILTGGGSLLRGSVEAASQILEIPVRTGTAHPDQVLCDEKWLDPSYATALGLLQWSGSSHADEGSGFGLGRKKPLLLRRLWSLVKELF